MGSFEQFPGMYSAAIVGPSQSREPTMSGALSYDPHVQAQFPGQNPQTYTKSDFEPHPHGAAADYYNDRGESVQHQPGVRAGTPMMLHNPDAHLVTPLAAAAPAQDTGHGSAADYYGSAAVATPSSSSKPAKPSANMSSASSSKPLKKPSRTASGAAVAATAAVAFGGVEAISSNHHSQDQTFSSSTYYNQQSATGQSSYQQPSQASYSTPPKSTMSNIPRPSRHNSEPVSAPGGGYYTQPLAVAGRLGKSSPPRTNHAGLYTATGAAAAGVAAYEIKQSYDLRHDTNAQYGAPPLPGPRPTSNYDYNSRPAYGQQGSYYAPANPRGMPMEMQHRHEHKGPITKLKDGFLNLLSSPEDVKKMEEYTEYIGVCKHCFDPRSSPSDGPRQHHFRPRKRDSFESLRRRSAERLRRKGSGDSLRRAGSKIEKENRYYSSGRKSTSKTDLLAGGLAVAGTAAAANAMFNDRKDFDDTYSVKSGHRASSVIRRRSSSSSRERRRRTTHGVIGADEYVTVRTRDGRLEQRRAHRSRSSSADRKSGFMGVAAGTALGAGAVSAASRHRRDSSPERVFVRHGEHQRSRSRSHSPGLGQIFGFSGSASKRRSPTSSQYERPAQSSGVLGSFFSPSTSGQKKEHRKKQKKSGSFFTFSNGSSSSSDAHMAFGGESRSSLGRQSSTKKRVSKKSSDERMNAAMLGLGATAAALAVAQSRNKISKKNSRADLAARRDLRARPHNPRHDLPDEDGWEDEISEDSVDEGLAFGADADARRRLSRQSMDSVASGKSSDGGLSAWGWRWGGKDTKRRRPSEERREDVYQLAHQSGSVFGALGADVAAGGVGQGYGRPIPKRAAGSLVDAYGRPVPDSAVASHDRVPQAPMQYIDPMPVSEAGSRHASSSMPGAFDNTEPPVFRPGPGPIQQPQPITPIQPVFTQAGYEPSMSATAGPRDAYQPRPDQPRRTMSSPLRNGSGSFVQDAALIGGAALATASIVAAGRNKEPGRVSFGFTEEQQRKADAEHERESKRERRSRALKEEAERFAMEEDERRERARLAKENSQREAEAGRLARSSREAEEEKQMRESREREEAYRREQARIADDERRRVIEERGHERERVQAEAELERRVQRDRELQAEIAGKQRELDERDEEKKRRQSPAENRERRERASSVSSKSWQGPVAAGVAGALVGAVLDGALHKEARESIADREHREERPSYDSRRISEPYIAKTIEPTNEHSGAPITDDDLIDPDFFKRRDRSPADLRRHSELARKAAEKVVADREDYYNAPEQSQKEFFMPKELLDRAPEDKERVADPVGGNDVHIYRAGIDEVPRDVPVYGKSEQPLRRPDIPMLNVIAPTPPHSVTGSVKGDRSAPPSPLAKSADEEGGTGRRPSTGRGVSWGEDKTHVYQVRTPDSYREDDRDGYIMAQDIPAEARTPLDGGKDEVVVEVATPGGGRERNIYGADELPHVPGGFEDEVRPVEEPAWEPPVSKKDKKKKKGSRSSDVLDSEQVTPAAEPEKSSSIPAAAIVAGAAAVATGAAVFGNSTPADEQGDYFPSSSSGKKDKKKGKKGAKAAPVEVFEDEPKAEPFPAFSEPAAEPVFAAEDEFAAPLSKKDKKKKAKKGLAFDEDSTPSTPAVEPESERVRQPEPAVAPWGRELTEREREIEARERAAYNPHAFGHDDRFESVAVTPVGFEDVWEAPLSKSQWEALDPKAKERLAFKEPAPSSPVEAAVAAPAVEDVWEAPLSKKMLKRREKEAKSGLTLGEPVTPVAERSEPTFEPVVQTAEPEAEVAWEAPLSKKEQKKRDKEAAKKGLSFDDSLPATPVQEQPSEPAQVPQPEVEDVWTPPLSKKEQKKREKEALQKKGLTFDDSLPSTHLDEFEKTVQTPEPDAEAAWEPPLSKKEQKKRDKEALEKAVAFDDSYPPSPLNEPVQGARDSVAEPGATWEAPLSKKEQKKRDKEAQRASGFDESYPTTPLDESVPVPEPEAAWEPPLSKKELKKREKEAQRNIGFDDSYPSTPLDEPSQSVEPEAAWEPPLSKKELKKREKEAKSSGFGDVVASVVAGAGIAAVVDAAYPKPTEEEDYGFTSGKKSKKNKKKLGEPMADDPRDVEPTAYYDPGVPTPNTNTLPGGWEESSSDAARDASPAPGGEKNAPSALSEVASPVDEFAGFDSKKGKKKKKRDSSRFNEPAASSPLRAEVAFDDYIGAPGINNDRAYTNGHSKEPERANGGSPERINDKNDDYFGDAKPVSDSPRNMSPEDTARSVVSAPSDERRRSKSGRSRRESDYGEDTPYAYDDSRSVAASEPAFENSKSKRRSRTQDDDTASVVSSRSKREKEESPTSEKKKKGGLFGLFSRKSSDGVPLSKTSTRDSKDGKDAEEDEERRQRRHRRKHTGSEYGDEDDSRSVVSSSSRRHRDREERDEDSRERHRRRRDDDGEDDKSSRHGSESRHRHRAGTLEGSPRSEKDQSFLGMRVEDMPPLPASRPTSPVSASVARAEEQGFGTLVSAEPASDVRGDTPLSQLEEQNRATESQHVVDSTREEVPAAQDLPALPESRPQSPTEELSRPAGVSAPRDLPALPASRPESPTEHFSRPGFTGRGASSTAVPLRFRQPPGSPLQPKERSSSFSAPGMESPMSPSSTTRSKSSRPRSSEFRNSGEFRPLYLVSRNAKIEDIEEQLPSLPSSKPSSRASSVQGSEDWHSAAESMTNSPVREKKLAIDTAEANKYKPEEDILGSQQTTPKASALPPMGSASQPRQAPQFYTWDDFQQDERLHDAESGRGEAAPDADVIDFARPPLSQRPSVDEQGILARAAEEATRQLSPTRMSKKDKKRFKGLAAAAMLGGGAAAAAVAAKEALERREDELAVEAESTETTALGERKLAAPTASEPQEEPFDKAPKESRKKKGKKGRSFDLAALPESETAPSAEIYSTEPAAVKQEDPAEPVASEQQEAIFEEIPKASKKKKGKKGMTSDLATLPEPEPALETPKVESPAPAMVEDEREFDRSEAVFDEPEILFDDPEPTFDEPQNPDEGFFDPVPKAMAPKKKGKKSKKQAEELPAPKAPETPTEPARRAEPALNADPDQSFEDWFGPATPVLKKGKKGKKGAIESPTVATPPQLEEPVSDVVRQYEPAVLGDDQIEDDFFGPGVPALSRSAEQDPAVMDYFTQPADQIVNNSAPQAVESAKETEAVMSGVVEQTPEPFVETSLDLPATPMRASEDTFSPLSTRKQSKKSKKKSKASSASVAEEEKPDDDQLAESTERTREFLPSLESAPPAEESKEPAANLISYADIPPADTPPVIEATVETQLEDEWAASTSKKGKKAKKGKKKPSDSWAEAIEPDTPSLEKVLPHVEDNDQPSVTEAAQVAVLLPEDPTLQLGVADKLPQGDHHAADREAIADVDDCHDPLDLGKPRKVAPTVEKSALPLPETTEVSEDSKALPVGADAEGNAQPPAENATSIVPHAAETQQPTAPEESRKSWFSWAFGSKKAAPEELPADLPSAPEVLEPIVTDEPITTHDTVLPEEPAAEKLADTLHNTPVPHVEVAVPSQEAARDAANVPLPDDVVSAPDQPQPADIETSQHPDVKTAKESLEEAVAAEQAPTDNVTTQEPSASVDGDFFASLGKKKKKNGKKGKAGALDPAKEPAEVYATPRDIQPALEYDTRNEASLEPAGQSDIISAITSTATHGIPLSDTVAANVALPDATETENLILADDTVGNAVEPTSRELAATPMPVLAASTREEPSLPPGMSEPVEQLSFPASAEHSPDANLTPVEPRVEDDIWGPTIKKKKGKKGKSFSDAAPTEVALPETPIEAVDAFLETPLPTGVGTEPLGLEETSEIPQEATGEDFWEPQQNKKKGKKGKKSGAATHLTSVVEPVVQPSTDVVAQREVAQTRIDGTDAATEVSAVPQSDDAAPVDTLPAADSIFAAPSTKKKGKKGKKTFDAWADQAETDAVDVVQPSSNAVPTTNDDITANVGTQEAVDPGPQDQLAEDPWEALPSKKKKGKKGKQDRSEPATPQNEAIAAESSTQEPYAPQSEMSQSSGDGTTETVASGSQNPARAQANPDGTDVWDPATVMKRKEERAGEQVAETVTRGLDGAEYNEQEQDVVASIPLDPENSASTGVDRELIDPGTAIDESATTTSTKEVPAAETEDIWAPPVKSKKGKKGKKERQPWTDEAADIDASQTNLTDDTISAANQDPPQPSVNDAIVPTTDSLAEVAEQPQEDIWGSPTVGKKGKKAKKNRQAAFTEVHVVAESSNDIDFPPTVETVEDDSIQAESLPAATEDNVQVALEIPSGVPADGKDHNEEEEELWAAPVKGKKGKKGKKSKLQTSLADNGDEDNETTPAESSTDRQVDQFIGEDTTLTPAMAPDSSIFEATVDPTTTADGPAEEEWANFGTSKKSKKGKKGRKPALEGPVDQVERQSNETNEAAVVPDVVSEMTEPVTPASDQAHAHAEIQDQIMLPTERSASPSHSQEPPLTAEAITETTDQQTEADLSSVPGVSNLDEAYANTPAANAETPATAAEDSTFVPAGEEPDDFLSFTTKKSKKDKKKGKQAREAALDWTEEGLVEAPAIPIQGDANTIEASKEPAQPTNLDTAEAAGDIADVPTVFEPTSSEPLIAEVVDTADDFGTFSSKKSKKDKKKSKKAQAIELEAGQDSVDAVSVEEAATPFTKDNDLISKANGGDVQELDQSNPTFEGGPVDPQPPAMEPTDHLFAPAPTKKNKKDKKKAKNSAAWDSEEPMVTVESADREQTTEIAPTPHFELAADVNKRDAGLEYAPMDDLPRDTQSAANDLTPASADVINDDFGPVSSKKSKKDKKKAKSAARWDIEEPTEVAKAIGETTDIGTEPSTNAALTVDSRNGPVDSGEPIAIEREPQPYVLDAEPSTASVDDLEPLSTKKSKKDKKKAKSAAIWDGDGPADAAKTTDGTVDMEVPPSMDAVPEADGRNNLLESIEATVTEQHVTEGDQAQFLGAEPDTASVKDSEPLSTKKSKKDKNKAKKAVAWDSDDRTDGATMTAPEPQIDLEDLAAGSSTTSQTPNGSAEPEALVLDDLSNDASLTAEPRRPILEANELDQTFTKKGKKDKKKAKKGTAFAFEEPTDELQKVGLHSESAVPSFPDEATAAPVSTAEVSGHDLALGDDNNIDGVSEEIAVPPAAGIDSLESFPAKLSKKDMKKAKKSKTSRFAEDSVDTPSVARDESWTSELPPMQGLATDVIDNHDAQSDAAIELPQEPIAVLDTPAEPEDDWGAFSTKKSKKDKKAKKSRDAVSELQDGNESPPVATDDKTNDEAAPLQVDHASRSHELEEPRALEIAPVPETDAPHDLAPILPATPMEAEDEFGLFATKKSKKDKKSKKGKNVELDEGLSPAPEPEETKDTAAPEIAAVAGTFAALAVAAVSEIKDDDPWAEAPLKTSKKEKRKGKKSGTATPISALENSELEPAHLVNTDQPTSATVETDQLQDPACDVVSAREQDDIERSAESDPYVRAVNQPEPDMSSAGSRGVNDANQHDHTEITNDDAATFPSITNNMDIDFAATLAAGLADSGFNPDMVVEDPVFHRRASPPGQIAEADPEEIFTLTKKNKKKAKGKSVSEPAKGLQDSDPPHDDFDAALSRGLQDSGFDAALLQGATTANEGTPTSGLNDEDAEHSFAKPTNKKNKKGKDKQRDSFYDATSSPADLGPAVQTPNDQEGPNATLGQESTATAPSGDPSKSRPSTPTYVDPAMTTLLAESSTDPVVLPVLADEAGKDEWAPLVKKKGKKGKRKQDRSVDVLDDVTETVASATAIVDDMYTDDHDKTTMPESTPETADNFVPETSDARPDQTLDIAGVGLIEETGEDEWAAPSKKKKGKKGRKIQEPQLQDSSIDTVVGASGTPLNVTAPESAIVREQEPTDTVTHERESQETLPAVDTEPVSNITRDMEQGEWAPPTSKKGKKGKKLQSSWAETDNLAIEEPTMAASGNTQAEDFAPVTDNVETSVSKMDVKVAEQTNASLEPFQESSLEPSVLPTQAVEDDFGGTSKKKGKKSKKRAQAVDTDLNPFLEPAQPASSTDTAEASAAETLDPASAHIMGGEGELDVDDMDKAYKAYKKNKRKLKKLQATGGANASADESAIEPDAPQVTGAQGERDTLIEGGENGQQTRPAANDNIISTERQHPLDTTDDQRPSAMISPTSPTSKVQSVFPGLKRVKRQPTSSHSDDGGRVNVLLHTSEVSQSLPVTVKKAPSPVTHADDDFTPIEDTFQQSTEPSSTRQVGGEPIAHPAHGHSNVGLGLAGVGAAAAALASHGSDWSFDLLRDSGREVVRDSGYHEGSSPTLKRSSMDKNSRDIPSVHTSASRESLRGRRSAEPLHIVTGSPQDWGLDLPRQRTEDDRQTSHGRTPSYQTPLEPTSRNRASYLFQSPPAGLADNAQTLRGPVTPNLDAETPNYFQDRSINAQTAESGRVPVSPMPTGPLSPRIPLDTIPEESNAHKRSIAVSNIDATAPDRSGKALRRTDTPKAIREQGLSPTVSSDAQGSRSFSTPTSDAIVPVASDENRPAKRVASDPRSSSVLSNRSSVSASQHRTPDERRTLSRTSDRSSTPTLRRVNLSGDLRAVSRASNRLGDSGSAVGVRSSPKTIPFEPPPTPPLNDEDDFDAGASRAANMADVFVSFDDSSLKVLTDADKRLQQGYGDGHGSQVSPTRPPSMRKRQSMHIMELESKVDNLVSENRALQEAKQQTADNDGVQFALNQREIQLHEKDNEIQQISAMLMPLRQEVDRLMQINAGLVEANRNLVDDTNGRYATLQAEHSHAQQQWHSSTRELDSLRQEHGKLTSGMRDAIAVQLSSALADKDHEIRKLREELDIATERIRALQVQIQSSRGADFLTGRDEDYFDGACQKLCQHVQQWVLRFSKVSDNRICRLSSDLRDDKIEARLDNALLDGSDVDKLLGDRVRRRDIFMSVVMTMVWEYVFTRYLFGMDREQRQKLKALEKILAEVGPPRAVAQWRATTLTLLAKRPTFANQCKLDTEAVAHEVFGVLCALLPPPTSSEQQLLTSLQKVIGVAVELSIEMRTQRSEYIMLPPLQPEYDTNGDLVRKVHFNASLMNERSGAYASNEELETERAIVKIVLFPLVVKKGDELGEGEEEIVVCPAQVLVHNDGGKGKKVVRVMSGAMEIDDPRRSRQSLISNRPGSAQMF